MRDFDGGACGDFHHVAAHCFKARELRRLARSLRQWRNHARRKRRSDEEKARLVAEAFSPGGNVSAVARSEGLDPSQLYAWRRKAPPRTGPGRHP
ncbi:transposase [Mesorhizobium sp. M1050]